MIVLKIDNSLSKIEGLTTGPFNELRKLLSYKVDSKSAYFAGNFGPRVKYCIDKKGVFPSGLCEEVKEFLKDNNIKYLLLDKRKVPQTKPSFMLNLQPYDDQLNAENAALFYKRGCISMPTGSGKSMVIALIVARLNVNTLIVVPSLEIKKQLKDSLVAVGARMQRIDIENIDSPKLKNYRDYDCLIIDEAHHVAAKTYQNLNKGPWSNIYYRFFLTATPFRNDTEETLLFKGIAGQLIYQLDYPKAVERGYIVPIEAYYYQLPKQTTEAYTWAQVYSELVVKNKTRNELIGWLLLTLGNIKSTLCLVKEVAHGQTLSELTGVPFVNGQDEESRQYIEMFNKGEIKALIGTTGVLGEGVDTKPCEYVIIAGLGKAKSQFMQQVGRAVRTYPGKESAKVILIKDTSHKFCSRHYKAQADILKEEYGVTPIKLDLP